MEISLSDDDVEDEWIQCGNNLEDISLFETEACEINVVDFGDLNVCDYDLIRFFGGKKIWYI